MVAITASFEISSQVGATAVRTRSAARANSSASKIPCGEFEPDLPADHLVGGAAKRGCQQAQQCLERAVAHDENGRRFDGEGDEPRDLLELLFESYGRFPRSSCRQIGAKPSSGASPAFIPTQGLVIYNVTWLNLAMIRSWG